MRRRNDAIEARFPGLVREDSPYHHFSELKGKRMRGRVDGLLVMAPDLAVTALREQPSFDLDAWIALALVALAAPTAHASSQLPANPAMGAVDGDRRKEQRSGEQARQLGGLAERLCLALEVHLLVLV